jgi:DNA-binding beta-propeller fold protein YncE
MITTAKAICLACVSVLFATSAAAQKDIPKLPPPSERYAVIVGVSWYDDELGIGKLNGADNDARALKAALEKYVGFPRDQIALLTSDQTGDRKSTRENINREVSRMATFAANGLMLFAFSGHGMETNGKALLLPSDIILKDAHSYVEEQAVTVESVVQKLRKAKQSLVFIDACREGIQGNKLSKGFNQAFALTGIHGLFFSTGFYESDGYKALSYELSEKKMGAFTWVVTQELENAANSNTPLTLGLLKQHLDRRVTDLVKEYGKEQKPDGRTGGFGAELLVLAGPSNDASRMTPLPGIPGFEVLMLEDGKIIQVTEQKSGRAMIYVRREVTPTAISGVLATASRIPGSESLAPLWSSTLLMAPNSEIYVADEKRGGVIVFGSDVNQGARHFIDFNTGKPSQMVVAARRQKVYVVDQAKQSVGVIDMKTHTLIGQFPTGKFPVAMAITPDERKLYVANQQPAPQGTISVIDLETGRSRPAISDVNCPQGLAMAPDGIFLYVVTQCGAGEDPVFVIDTRTDTKAETIPGLAVGSTIAIAPAGEKLYVARSGYYTRDASTERPLSVPDQVSVIITKTNKLEASYPMNAVLFATTPDGKYLIAGDGPRLNFIDTTTFSVARTIQFDTVPGGVVVSRNKEKTGLLCYVWLPEENRLFFTALTGLLPVSRN